MFGLLGEMLKRREDMSIQNEIKSGRLALLSGGRSSEGEQCGRPTEKRAPHPYMDFLQKVHVWVIFGFGGRFWSASGSTRVFARGARRHARRFGLNGFIGEAPMRTAEASDS